MNKVILMGRLTRDPEIRYSQSADPIAIARFSLAVNRRFKKEGEPDADFVNCVAFGKQAEFAEKFLKKGMQILVTGRLSVRNYDDPTTNQRRTFTEVVVEESEFTESRSAYEARIAHANPIETGFSIDRATNEKPAAVAPKPAASAPAYEPEGFSAITESIDEDDLPF